MSVRQGLADKLRNVSGAPITTWDMIGWGDMADECIRQMEWARGIGYRHAELASDDADYVLAVNRPPLTLAPEDWKP